MAIDVSIVTPSMNMLGYLKRCSASLKDQDGIRLEHIVIDGGSADGTQEWLASRPDIVSHSGPDKGMYDAINKGLKIASGDIIAYLNCDEQYLPCTLKFVKEYFDAHPDVDIIFGNYLVIDPDGKLISYRKAFQPRLLYIQATHLYVFTCTMFFRRKIVDEGNFFDDTYRSIADSLFVMQLFRKNYRMRHINRYMSIFTMTGKNQLISGLSLEEIERAKSEKGMRLPRLFKYPIEALRLVEKVLRGCYHEKFPLSYSIYLDNAPERTPIVAAKGSPLWGLGKSSSSLRVS